MKTIIFTNNKGGVGKTASVTNTAYMLAAKYGKKVLIIDLDPQMNTTSMFMDVDFIEMFNEILENEEKKDFDQSSVYEKSVEDLLLNPDMDTREAVYRTKYPNLDIIPAKLSLSSTETKMISDTATIKQFILREHLDKIRNDYDYCVIDTSPSLSLINTNGLAAADEVYIPINSDGGSLIGIANTKKLIRTVQGYNKGLKIGGIFYARWDKAKIISKTIVGLVEKYFGEMSLPVMVNINKNIEEGSLFQAPLLLADPKEKLSVTKEYLKLVEIIINRNEKKEN